MCAEQAVLTNLQIILIFTVTYMLVWIMELQNEDMMRTYEHKNKNEMKDGELHSEKRRKMFIW
jgi:hypothetical protein